MIEDLPYQGSISLRVAHSNLDPNELTKKLNLHPKFAFKPGESQIPFRDCKSAGYWCHIHTLDPSLPLSELFDWAEQTIKKNRDTFWELRCRECDINLYTAIYLNTFSIGFSLVNMPTITELEIPIGIEVFS